MMRDEFLSEEDLDLRTLTDEELAAVWTAWLRQAQATNDVDERLYSHGVFEREPPWCGQRISRPARGGDAHAHRHGNGGRDAGG
jgi:hypothetical protein